MDQNGDLQSGEAIFARLIEPVSIPEFFETYWEKQPLYISRGDAQHYDGWADVTKEDVAAVMAQFELPYKQHVDVTRVVDGVRETLNGGGPEVIADADEVMQRFDNDGCTIRLVHPERFMDVLWELLAPMQELFTSTMGANIYLTPAGAQGFAPHYDDVDVFILQVEGAKRWFLHAPIDDESVLPRVSSRDFTQAEVGAPTHEIVLEQGDILYLPRGVIHQAQSLGDKHSLHVTVSTYQKHTYMDFLLAMFPTMVAAARAADPAHALRTGLPPQVYDFLGSACSSATDSRRAHFAQTLAACLDSVLEIPLPIDATADELAVRFMYDSLPPALTTEELALMFDPERGADAAENELSAATPVRLARRYVARMSVRGEGSDAQVVVAHNASNSRYYHEFPAEALSFGGECEAGLAALFAAFPDYVSGAALAQALGAASAGSDADSDVAALDDEAYTAMLQSLYEASLLVRAPPKTPMRSHPSKLGALVPAPREIKRKGDSGDRKGLESATAKSVKSAKTLAAAKPAAARGETAKPVKPVRRK